MPKAPPIPLGCGGQKGAALTGSALRESNKSATPKALRPPLFLPANFIVAPNFEHLQKPGRPKRRPLRTIVESIKLVCNVCATLDLFLPNMVKPHRAVEQGFNPHEIIRSCHA
jgi:hypothetical protein